MLHNLRVNYALYAGQYHA